jgi:acyl carrier protein
VHTFLLSCRALGRGVEHQMLAGLWRSAQNEGCSTVFIQVRATGRNRPARAFLDAVAGAHAGDFGYAIPLATLAGLPPWPEIVELGRTGAMLKSIGEDEAPSPAPELPDERFARELGSVRSLLAAMDLEQERVRAIDVVFEAPSTPTERRLARIWNELLHVHRVGALDGFFDLGGDSLLGVVLLSRLQETFGVEIPFRILLEGVTLRGLAAAVDAAVVELSAHADVAEMLDRLEEMSDEEIRLLLEAT